MNNIVDSKILDQVIIPLDLFVKINRNRIHNQTLIKYYDQLRHDPDFKNFLNIDNKITSLDDCNKYFDFDVYHKSKIKDLKKTNHCKDKFCNNCKNAKQILRMDRFKPELEKYKENLYHMVLTVENVDGDNLKNSIKQMFKAFRSLIRYFSLTEKLRSYDLDFEFKGCIRSLEITYNVDENTYHPHLHCAIVWNKNPVISKSFVHKNFSYHNDPVSKTRILKTKFSSFEILIQKIWRLLYEGKPLYKNLIEKSDGYSVTIDKFYDEDYLELFKYMIKDVDQFKRSMSYDVFKVFVTALHKCRQLQGYGCFYNIKDDDKKSLYDLVDSDYERIINSLVNGEIPVKKFEKIRDILSDLSYAIVSKRILVYQLINLMTDED